jgi:hypothetical protein
LYNLNVTYGELESTNYWWNDDAPNVLPNAVDRDAHTRLIRDFNYNDNNNPGIFQICNLSEGIYSITIFIGDNETEMFVPVPGGRHEFIDVDVNATGSFSTVVDDLFCTSQYQTRWFTITKTTNSATPLQLRILNRAGRLPVFNTWLINGLIIERGVKGIKVEAYYD